MATNVPAAQLIAIASSQNAMSDLNRTAAS
jgi:hypothetical protein